MPGSVLSLFVGATLIGLISPGPGNILSMNTMLVHGWRRGRRVFFGIIAGYFVVETICALAVYGLNRWLHPVLEGMKFVGAAYLGWLAVHIIRSRPDTGQQTKRPSFWSGFSLQFVNVKIYVYGIATLSGFVAPYYSGWLPLVMIGLMVSCCGSLASLLWAFAGLGLQSVYAKYYLFINWVMGLFLIYCAAALFFH